MIRKVLLALVGMASPALAQSVASDATATPTRATSDVATKDPVTKPKQFEEWSTANRIACVAQLGGHHFNLKELSMPFDE